MPIIRRKSMPVNGSLGSGEKEETTSTRHASSTHAQEEDTPQKTKNLVDPVGIGTGVFQHCPPSVFSSQTVELPFVGGTCPPQQTESGSVAIKGHPPSSEIIIFIMSEIQRITLISDSTNEFPNNTNNSFKVRLPERTTLAGDRWHASLLSMSVPDKGQSNGVIATDPHKIVIQFHMTFVTRKYILASYKRVSLKTKDYHVKFEEIMSSKQSVTSGNLFWKRVMQAVHNKSTQQLMYEQKYAWTHERNERPHVSVKKNWIPNLSWKDDSLILHAVPEKELMNFSKTKALTTFAIDLGVAEKFGLI